MNDIFHDEKNEKETWKETRGNALRITSPLWRESTYYRFIPSQTVMKILNKSLGVSKPTVEQIIELSVIFDSTALMWLH